MTYSALQFTERLFGDLALNKKGRYYIAYSGGVDSTALLHMMCEVRKRFDITLIALHVNHNFNELSSEWAEHCKRECEKLDVPLVHTSLELEAPSEAVAREARYHWFSHKVLPDSILVTAHHSQDRAETLLFNLMRGAGSKGLSSMRAVRPFFRAILARPLLDLSQETILDYANRHQLSWVEDPSNQTSDFSRNHIRNEVLPVLSNFRSDAVQNIVRAAKNLEQENNLLREVAITDLVEVREHPRHPIDQAYALCFDDVLHLSKGRQANLVRFWLNSLNLHVPSQRFLQQVLAAFEDPPASTAVLQEGGCQFRFYRGFMYVMPALHEVTLFSSIDWNNIDQPLDLHQHKIRIDATSKLRELLYSHSPANVRLTARSQLTNPKALQGHSLNLKKWLQEIGIPPWRRQSLPLLTMANSGNEVVLGPIDQQTQSDWVSLECPVN